MSVEISRDIEDGVAVFRLEGPLDSTTSGQLQSVIMPAAEAAPHRLVIDFARVGYVSSAGLRVVLMAAKQARAAGGEIAIFGLTNPVREMFDISGFALVIAIVETQADAIQATRGTKGEDIWR